MAVVSPTTAFTPDSSHALQSLRFAGQGSADHHAKSGAGVDDDLVVGGVVVVLGLLGHTVVAGGHQSAVDDQPGVLRDSLTGLKGEHRPEVVDGPVRRRLRSPGQQSRLAHGEVRAPAGSHRQRPVLQRQTPRPAPAHRVRALAPQNRHQLAELRRPQPGERATQGAPTPCSPQPRTRASQIREWRHGPLRTQGRSSKHNLAVALREPLVTGLSADGRGRGRATGRSRPRGAALPG